MNNRLIGKKEEYISVYLIRSGFKTSKFDI